MILDSANRKVWILAIAAVGILSLGVLLKPAKPSPPPPNPGDSANLERLVRREELRGAAAFLAERAAEAAESVVWIPEAGASGVVWERAGQALTTGHLPRPQDPDHPLVLLQTPAKASPAVRLPAEMQPGRHALIVGRTADGRLTWASSVSAGARTANCHGAEYRELLVSAAIAEWFRGAAVFDLDGRLAGVVADCDGARRVVAVESVQTILAVSSSPTHTLLERYGIAVAKWTGETPVDGLAGEPGLLVSTVEIGGVADGWGIEAGDVITKLDAATPADGADLLMFFAGGGPAITLVRDGRTRHVRLPASAADRATASGLRLILPAGRAPVAAVIPGTPSWDAGLRSGDRILQIGGRRGPAADLARVGAGRPLLIVYERDLRRFAVVLSR